MMKKILFSVFLFTLLFSCDKRELETKNSSNETLITEEDKVLAREEINNEIYKSIQETGDFNWNNASEKMILSALSYCNNVLTVGYKPSGGTSLKSTSLKESKKDIINKIIEVESDNDILKSTNDILVFDNEELVLVDVVITSIETIRELKTMENVRYIEPAGYLLELSETELKSSEGFGCARPNQTISSDDYTVYAPGCKVPWNYFKHNIPDAWTFSTGSGITIGLIDTGVSSTQPLLSNNFNNGYSSGRSISKYGLYVDSFWPWSTKTDGNEDLCGHGTYMASAIAAPRNNKNLPVGVAYNCNLIAYRATSDVFLDDYHEKNGVASALTELADNPNVKIISMSVGCIFTVNKISDAIKYAYSKGKLIIAAGGTSSTFTNNLVEVIFPANMSETVAVTGITDNETYTQCSDCHKGSKIDFTVTMQRESDADLTTPINGFYENQTLYCGGSSIATAMTAGMAALVWGKYPDWTNSQVLTKLKQSAELYPTKSSNYGYGCIDILSAVN